MLPPVRWPDPRQMRLLELAYIYLVMGVVTFQLGGKLDPRVLLYAQVLN